VEGARGEPASVSARHAWRATRGASTAVGERREPGARDALGGRREARAGSQTGVREVRGDCGAGETGAEQHFFLAMPENGPYSHISVARGEEFFRREGAVNSDDEIRRRRGAVDGQIGQRRVSGLNALGRHLLLELFDCDSDAINNLENVKGALVEAAKRAQATIVDVVFHEFNPFGISGVVVIAESHLSIHTWPEYKYAAVDIFSCGDVLQPEVAANYLVEQFGAERTSVVDVQRGMFLNSAVPIVNKPVAVS
jgi:S-adenosylmethionine decarboxylase